MGGTSSFEDRLRAQAQRVRAEGVLGRSDVMIRLFDFLVAQSLAGRAPKEIEIAQDVFDKRGDFDVMLDASVRVYIHRLRRKIDDFYAADRSGDDRLFIPKGEYRLGVTDAAVEPESDGPVVMPPAAPPRRWRWLTTSRGLALAFSCLLALNLGGWIIATRTMRSNPLVGVVDSAFWQPLASNGRPTVLATGDYYIFGEAPDTLEVTRLIREFSVNSKDDLDRYLMAHPADMGRYVDMGLHYLPTSIPAALHDIFPIVTAATGGHEGQELLVSMSQLTPDMLKKANIVYVGYLSGLGMLRDPVFNLSGFKIGSGYDELIDRKSGRHYISDQGDVTGRKSPWRDYAYIASIPGPAGTQVLIVGGTRDPAVLQAAEIASDPHQLSRIAATAGTSSAFEALYEVRTLNDLNLGSKLVVARSLRTDGLWNLDRARQPFPDQMPPAR